MKQKRRIIWKSPVSRIERIGLVITGVFGVLMWILANKLLTLGITDTVHFIASLPVRTISLFWFALIGFHFGLMFLITRSIVIGGTHHIFDYFVGMIAIIGVFMVVASIIAGITLGLGTVEWFFNMRQPIMFGFGFITETLTLLYFAFTE